MADRIIVDGAIVDDTWYHLDDCGAIEGGDILVSLARWQTERNALRAHPGKLGVRIPNTVDVRSLADDLQYWSAIVLTLPTFKDGRAYSQARILRDQLGYRGELRATGEVLRDQLFYMRRVGFNAFAVQAHRRIEDVLLGLADFTVTYQPAADEPLAHFRR